MNEMAEWKKLPTDQWINELVRLYTVAINATQGNQSSEAAAVADGLEKAAIYASEGEALMIKSVTMERLAFARMKSAGIK